ncbi:Hypothetical protein GbCGDNIH7_7286a [Granulibacter bethesdensis]|nr:Hypothetical protein GbCGDNIH4_7240 [Granulibacter bethesdensis CGDNIH4]APH59788.1 Hypothetical protein GbCGDNIH7_7286a [Granulibacter bethesdensis]
MTIPGRLYHPLVPIQTASGMPIYLKVSAGIGITEGQLHINPMTEKQARENMWANVYIGPRQT